MSGPTDFDVARIYLRPQRQLPLVSTAVSGFAQRQQRELPKTVGKECVLPIRHLCQNRLRTPCGFPGRQIRIERREAHMVA